MRTDVAPILIGMGYVANVDFIASQSIPTSVDVLWLAATPMPTEAEIDAAFNANPNIYQDFLNTEQKTAATTSLDTNTIHYYKAIRAAAALVVDEINILRQWEMSFKAEVAAATSLANLQTRVAALPNLPDRTMAQAKTAMQAKINAGSV